MSQAKAPRVVVVTRPSRYDELMARHSTRQQAAFFLKGRGQTLDEVDRSHSLWVAAHAAISQAIPVSWRRSRVSRRDISRFVFEPDDLVVAIGQDGLVANTAKYLSGQRVIGINPDPDSYDGILVLHTPKAAKSLFRAAVDRRCEIEKRSMVCVRMEDGQRLVALNEIFVGHRSHQSARYEISWDGITEVQSSSGLIVSSGTGATGWARSICLQHPNPPELPAPTDARLAFLVREPFPSVGTGTEIQNGSFGTDHRLDVVSHMNEGGVIFGDGIEEDRIDFHWGMRADISVATQKLQLVR